MKKIQLVSVVLFIGLSFNSFGQIKEFDKMEMLYAQQHYKLVYKKANRLLDVPDYDFSMIPTYYKSISLFQLCQNELYLKKHPRALDEAKELFLKVKNSPDGKKIFIAHQNEIIFLKNDLLMWSEELRRDDQKVLFDQVQLILKALFDTVPSVDKQQESKPESVSAYKKTGVVRDDMVNYSKMYIGTPYLWAGTDAKGFDCSGFTGYIMKEFGYTVPRRAIDQQKNAVEVKEKNVQKGDLVFFDNGSGISHVGLIISEKGEPKVMIHASSSQGVIITNLETSDYWKSRISSYGTYVN